MNLINVYGPTVFGIVVLGFILFKQYQFCELPIC